MKGVLLKILVIIFIIILAFVLVFIFALKPIDRSGILDSTLNNTSSQIAKAVGRGEVDTFSNLLEFIKYPGVSQYTLERNKNIDHNRRSINFETNDKFELVLAYYQTKFPDNKPNVEEINRSSMTGEPSSPFKRAYFQIQVSESKPSKSFFIFETQEIGVYFRINITEFAGRNITFVSLSN